MGYKWIVSLIIGGAFLSSGAADPDSGNLRTCQPDAPDCGPRALSVTQHANGGHKRNLNTLSSTNLRNNRNRRT